MLIGKHETRYKQQIIQENLQAIPFFVCFCLHKTSTLIMQQLLNWRYTVCAIAYNEQLILILKEPRKMGNLFFFVFSQTQ